MSDIKKENIVEAHQVTDVLSSLRLSDYVLGKFITYPTNSGIRKAIKKGLVLINGKQGKSGDYIRGGELLEICKPKETKAKPIIDIPITVLFEDDYLVVVNKPAGIEVSGNKKWTLENALQPHVQKSTQPDALDRPQPVHRLDYPTSGVLVAAKTAKAVLLLNKMFEYKEIQKTYIAITIGEMLEVAGDINLPVDEKESHSVFTQIQSVESPRFGKLNLVSLLPKTGRRHQLRKHLQGVGNPILGDLLYGPEGLLLKGKGLYLHAERIEFTHPITEEIILVSSTIPGKFTKIFPQE